LAIAYSWTGEFAEGLALINDLLSGELSDQVRFQALLAKATLQMGSPGTALLTLNGARAYRHGVNDTYLGMWHNQCARALKELKRYDQASIEYAGAEALFERSGDAGGVAMALNNVAGVYLKWGKYSEAHEASKKAVAMFTALSDPRLPHAQDQNAQVLVALGKGEEAKLLIDRVIATVESGDRNELLLECLLTRASALIQLGSAAAAFKDIERADEISKYLSRSDLRITVAKARKDLATTFANQSHVDLVRLALDHSGGNIRAAALKLGKNHTSLIEFINNHGLLRKPPRLKSVMRKK
jgi:tetratricopeptide (TPR) repeat protein